MLICTTGGSDKFYRIVTDPRPGGGGYTVTSHYGPNTRRDRPTVTVHHELGFAEAEAYAQRLLQSKLQKGYVIEDGPPPVPVERPPSQAELKRMASRAIAQARASRALANAESPFEAVLL